MSEIKHTPLPWEWVKQEDRDPILVSKLTGETIIDSAPYENIWFATFNNNSDGIVPDAEFIVRACNSHYELVEALESANFTYLGDQYVAVINPDVVKQALNKAKGVGDERI